MAVGVGVGVVGVVVAVGVVVGVVAVVVGVVAVGVGVVGRAFSVKKSMVLIQLLIMIIKPIELLCALKSKSSESSPRRLSSLIVLKKQNQHRPKSLFEIRKRKCPPSSIFPMFGRIVRLFHWMLASYEGPILPPFIQLLVLVTPLRQSKAKK